MHYLQYRSTLFLERGLSPSGLDMITEDPVPLLQSHADFAELVNNGWLLNLADQLVASDLAARPDNLNGLCPYIESFE